MKYGSNRLVKAIHEGYDIVYGDLEEIDREEFLDKKFSMPEDKLSLGLGSSVAKRDYVRGGEALGRGHGLGNGRCGSPNARTPFYKVGPYNWRRIERPGFLLVAYSGQC